MCLFIGSYLHWVFVFRATPNFRTVFNSTIWKLSHKLQTFWSNFHFALRIFFPTQFGVISIPFCSNFYSMFFFFFFCLFFRITFTRSFLRHLLLFYCVCPIFYRRCYTGFRFWSHYLGSIFAIPMCNIQIWLYVKLYDSNFIHIYKYLYIMTAIYR